MISPVFDVKLSDGSPESELRVRTLWWYYAQLPANARQTVMEFYQQRVFSLQDEGQWPLDNGIVIMELRSKVLDRIPVSAFPLFANPLTQEEYEAGYKLVLESFDQWVVDHGRKQDEIDCMLLLDSLLQHLPHPNNYKQVLRSNLEGIEKLSNGVTNPSPQGQKQTKQTLLSRWKNLFKH